MNWRMPPEGINGHPGYFQLETRETRRREAYTARLGHADEVRYPAKTKRATLLPLFPKSAIRRSTMVLPVRSPTTQYISEPPRRLNTLPSRKEAISAFAEKNSNSDETSLFRTVHPCACRESLLGNDNRTFQVKDLISPNPSRGNITVERQFLAFTGLLSPQGGRQLPKFLASLRCFKDGRSYGIRQQESDLTSIKTTSCKLYFKTCSASPVSFSHFETRGRP